MKKLLLICMAVILSLCLVGCQGKDVEDNRDNPPIVDNNSGENVDDGNNEPDINEPIVDPSTDPMSATNTMTAIMEKAEISVNMPMQEAIPAEMPESFIGLSSGDFASYVMDSVVYESMISPSNQSFCIVKVNDLKKVEDLKKSIFENCNPRKWVCMSAERVIVLDSGEYIMLAMTTKENGDKVIEAFKDYFDNNVGPILDKTIEE